jgi:hypothetical protein
VERSVDLIDQEITYATRFQYRGCSVNMRGPFSVLDARRRNERSRRIFSTAKYVIRGDNDWRHDYSQRTKCLDLGGDHWEAPRDAVGHAHDESRRKCRLSFRRRPNGPHFGKFWRFDERLNAMVFANGDCIVQGNPGWTRQCLSGG